MVTRLHPFTLAGCRMVVALSTLRRCPHGPPTQDSLRRGWLGRRRREVPPARIRRLRLGALSIHYGTYGPRICPIRPSCFRPTPTTSSSTSHPRGRRSRRRGWPPDTTARRRNWTPRPRRPLWGGWRRTPEGGRPLRLDPGGGRPRGGAQWWHRRRRRSWGARPQPRARPGSSTTRCRLVGRDRQHVRLFARRRPERRLRVRRRVHPAARPSPREAVPAAVLGRI